MKRIASPTNHSIPTAFVFLLIGMFALTSLTLTLFGTRVYRRVTDSAAHSSDAQLTLSYLSNRVRTFDTQGGVQLAQRDGLSVLCLYETLEGERYETAIYATQGALWERFASADVPFDPADAERLVDVQSLQFSSPAPQLIQAMVVMADGETRSTFMALRSDPAEEVP
ncbi:MAG: DUF4860 domain-containing protein [Candidatus Limiplasma sp.]|nr:DUF4860 domain-containing protein [Candidatus Limiplasma sp.]